MKVSTSYDIIKRVLEIESDTPTLINQIYDSVSTFNCRKIGNKKIRCLDIDAPHFIMVNNQISSAISSFREIVNNGNDNESEEENEEIMF